jgi:CRP/FNR family transcriptional regulator, anaerobic regulatory protein
MNTAAIKAYIDRMVTFSESEWQAFEACLYERHLAKKELLLAEGQHCDFVAFVLEGAFRFYKETDGEEIEIGFFFPGDFVSNYRSFLTNTPSEHNIVALKDAQVLMLPKKELFELYDQHKPAERLGRLIAENLFLEVVRRLDSFQHATPEDRYQGLVKRNSKLLQEIPQYMLASYLGVKPETLSRIRARK